MSKFERKMAAFAVATMLFLASGLLPMQISASDSAVVSIFVDGGKQSITTDASTVGEVLDRAEIELGENDLVEPHIGHEITNQVFNVNVYRARPVLIVDGEDEHRVESAYQSARLMVENSGVVEVFEEDRFDHELIRDFLDEGYVGYKVTIERAMPIHLEMGDKATVIRTHAATVGEMFEEAEIAIGNNDIVNPSLDTAIESGMNVSLTQVGFETVTEEESISPETITEYDNNRPVGYESVKEDGEPGIALVTYEIEYRNGEEAKRKELRRVVEKKPKPRVVVVGNNLGASTIGGVWEQLRQCESGGNYANKNNPIYRGAYQFDQRTWNANAPSDYVGVDPADAPAAIQDRAAQTLYSHRGWQPWPVCGASLPRI